MLSILISSSTFTVAVKVYVPSAVGIHALSIVTSIVSPGAKVCPVKTFSELYPSSAVRFTVKSVSVAVPKLEIVITGNSSSPSNVSSCVIVVTARSVSGNDITHPLSSVLLSVSISSATFTVAVKVYVPSAIGVHASSIVTSIVSPGAKVCPVNTFSEVYPSVAMFTVKSVSVSVPKLEIVTTGNKSLPRIASVGVIVSTARLVPCNNTLKLSINKSLSSLFTVLSA